MRALAALGLALALTLLAGCGGERTTAPDPPPTLLRAGALPFPDDSTVEVFVVPDYGLHLEQRSPDGGTAVRDVRVAFGPDPGDPDRWVQRETVLLPDGDWYRETWTYHPENPSAPVVLGFAVPGEEQTLRIDRLGNLATYTLVWTRDGERREAAATLDLSRWGDEVALEEARTRFRDAFADFSGGSRLLASPWPRFLDTLGSHEDLESTLAGVVAGKEGGPTDFDLYLRQFCNLGKNIQKTVCAMGLFFPQFTSICAASIPANALCDLILAMRAAQLTMNDPAEPDTLCAECWTPPDTTGP